MVSTMVSKWCERISQPSTVWKESKPDVFKERLAAWQDLLREKSQALAEAVDEWAARRNKTPGQNSELSPRFSPQQLKALGSQPR